MGRNARFWTYQNDGWVKLTIRPGQSLSIVEGGRTDEGYSWTATTWKHDGERVIRERTTQAHDCDGRLDSAEDAFCPLDRLASEPSCFDEGIMHPEWQLGDYCQRDYAAEAMGY